LDLSFLSALAGGPVTFSGFPVEGCVFARTPVYNGRGISRPRSLRQEVSFQLAISDRLRAAAEVAKCLLTA